MKELNVINGQGITASILAQLQKDGIVNEGKNLSGSVWNQIMQLVSEDPEGSKQYSGGSNFVLGNSEEARASWKNNFVIDKNQVISFTEELWNKIVKLAKGEKLNDEIKEPPLALQPLSLVGIKPIQITPLENNELPIPEFKLIEIP